VGWVLYEKRGCGVIFSHFAVQASLGFRFGPGYWVLSASGPGGRNVPWCNEFGGLHAVG